MDIKAQTPAEGILLTKNWGDTRSYSIHCDCGDDTHSHYLWVEADDNDVTVTIYTEQTTDFWSENKKLRYDIDNIILQKFDWFWKSIWNGLCLRLKLTKEVWLKGSVTYQSTLCLSRQAAINYADALTRASLDVSEFRKFRDNSVTKHNKETV